MTTTTIDLDRQPETTDEARAYLMHWHQEAFTTAPFFSSYIENTLAGDFAYHLARWLARRSNAGEAAGIKTWDARQRGSEYGRNAEACMLDEIAELRAALSTQQAAREQQEPVATEGYILMPRRLTAENGAKALFIGEFSESTRVLCHECDGSGEDSEFDAACTECGGEGTIERKVAIEWDTIKRIYALAVEHLAAPVAQQSEAGAPELTVWEGAMPESNGRQNYTAVLHRKDSEGLDKFSDGFQFALSEYPDRTRYEADFMRWLIGERGTKPEMWDDCYDMDKHSGYKKPEATAPTAAAEVPRELLERCLTAMKHAVTFGETGKGRPPSQTCMFEIEELEAYLAGRESAAPPSREGVSEQAIADQPKDTTDTRRDA